MLGLTDATIMTSMVQVSKNQFSWDGKNPVKNIDVKSTNHGNCTILSQLQLSSISCDEKHNFMCESASKDETTTKSLKMAPPAEYYNFYSLIVLFCYVWNHFPETLNQ
jgi:hypothetical protein